MEENTTKTIPKMSYKKRTILLILVWIVFSFIVGIAALYYGYFCSVEMATKTIRTSLVKVDNSIEDLIANEAQIRGTYEQAHANMGQMIPFLQEHGLEDTIPSKSHMKKYAELLGANYIAILDPDLNTAVSYGKLKKTKREAVEITTEQQMKDYLTSSHSLVPEDQDRTVIEGELDDGYRLVYQVSNKETNIVQNEAFSWRAVLRDLKLPNEASLVVISKQDDKILVHPNEELVGKSYNALGFPSKEDFLNAYEKPDEEGIAYQKSLPDFLQEGNFSPKLIIESSGSGYSSQININFLGKGSGYIDTTGLYVICNMPESMTAFYLLQQRGVLFIYLLISILVLCYILLHFRWCRRKEKKAQAEGADAKAEETAAIGYRFGFIYDRAWSRRLIFCCIIMLVLCLGLSLHVELLLNSSQVKIQTAQAEKMTKVVEKRNEQHREQLNDWFNDTNIQMAQVISYVLTRDDSLQSRDIMKEIAERFGVPEVYLFDQDGEMIVTNSDFDHIDLHKKLLPRMSSTFLPLLFGMEDNASTAVTKTAESVEQAEKEKVASAERIEEVGNLRESAVAYAGVSIRNKADLCDGCLGIATEPLMELWGNEAILDEEDDAFDTVMDLTKDSVQIAYGSLTPNQLTLISYTGLRLALCFALFYCIAVLQRRSRRKKKEKETAAHERRKIGSAFAEGATAIRSKIENTAAKVVEEAGGGPSDREQKELLHAVFGREKDQAFSERWKYENVPFRDRTPESQLIFIMKGILVFLFLGVIVLYLTQGSFLDENSMLRDVVKGGWEKGFNLYAITATEMIIIVAAVLWMALHRLVYFVARFSSPRGETVCHLIYSMITYAAVLVAIYYSLSTFGVQTKTILAGAGILGIVISFGAQGTIADILSGMFLIFEDVIHVGDYIKVGMNTGIVKSVGVRMTKIQSFGTVISINNAELKATQNMTDGVAYITCSLAIDGSESTKRVKQIVGQELPDINEKIKATGYTATNVSFDGVTSSDGLDKKLEFSVFGSSYGSDRVKKLLTDELTDMCERNEIHLAGVEPQTKKTGDSENASAGNDQIS